MAIDSHMHINSLVLCSKEEEINEINNNSNLEYVVNVGLNEETSRESIKLAKDNDKFYSSVGVHPLYIDGADTSFIYDLSSYKKVVAVGEIGLDSNGDYFIQKKYLIPQLSIANNLHLPVIIHSNNMNSQVVQIFENIIKPKYGCVFHCFQPDLETLEYLIDNGYYISFAGRITYLNANKSLEVIRKVPDELFLIETDSPYISPEPFRNEINHSSNLMYIIDKIATVKETSYEDIERKSTQNTKRLFRKIK